MSQTAVARRPFGITVLVALGVVQGVFAILAGLFLVLDRDDARLRDVSTLTEGGLLWIGLFIIALGVITVLLALALGRGSEIVRIFLGVLTALHLGSGLWALVALHGEQRWAAAYSVVISAVILYILFGSERSEAFFEANRSTA